MLSQGTVRRIEGVLLALWGLLFWPSQIYALDIALYRALDFPHPICGQRIQLNAAQETFVEIANPIVGVEGYNDLVRTYRSRNWESFDLKRDIFRKVHESSPLLEPLSYLMAQAAFERTEPVDGERAKAAERQLRAALVLYPKSELAPVVSATMAEFWIRAGRYANALALYQSLRNQYPHHSLHCLFTVGAGEAAYLLGDRDGARAALQDATQVCRDPRLRLSAEIRLVDLVFDTDPKLAEAGYDRIIKNHSPRVEALHPPLFHNLGELRYRQGNFAAATYLFSRFLELNKDIEICAAQASKRVADTDFRSGVSLAKVAGAYSAVMESSPGTEIGRFSQLHALMLTLSSQSLAEQARRLRLLDEGMDQVQDPKMREVLYIEKGLAWLESGEFKSVAYLAKIPQAHEGELGRLVRIRVAAQLEKMVLRQGIDALSSLESAFVPWIKDSPAEKTIGARYEGLVLKGFNERVALGDRGGALQLLEQWEASPYWSEVPFSTHASDQLAVVILADLFSATAADSRDRENRATEYLKGKASWEPFFRLHNKAVVAALAAAVGDVVEVQNSEAGEDSRSPASLPKTQPLRELTIMARAMAAQRLGDEKEAERLLRQVKSKEREPMARENLLSLYLGSRRPNEALELALRGLAAASAEARAEQAQRALRIVNDGKLWDAGPRLLAQVAKLKLRPIDQAPFLFLAGRAAFEKKDYSRAALHYEKGLDSLTDGEPAAEARYRLGKSLLRLQRNAEARRVWQVLVQMEDSFWSPLAQNDLKLIH